MTRTSRRRKRTLRRRRRRRASRACSRWCPARTPWQWSRGARSCLRCPLARSQRGSCSCRRCYPGSTCSQSSLRSQACSRCRTSRTSSRRPSRSLSRCARMTTARRMRSASWRRTRNCFCAFGTTRTTSTSRVRCPHPSLWSPTLSPCLRFVLTPHRSPEPRRPSDGGAEHARRWRRRSRRVEGLGGGRRLVTRRTPVKSCATTTDGGRFVVLRGVWARSSETRY